MVAKFAELTLGRTFGITLDDGDEFFPGILDFCRTNDVKQGYISTFIGAVRHARVAGTCTHAEAEAPMFDSFVDVDYAEVVGSGTIAYDSESDTLLPHVHVALGKRMHGATGITSHLFEAEIQLLAELVIVEVVAPTWTRPKNPNLFDVPLLTFGS